MKVIEETVKLREERGITRPDMLQLMIDCKDEKSELDLIEIPAHALLFFLAGFETTSMQLCLIAHELAMNPEVQEKLQAEIDATMEKSDGKPTYETINSITYLDVIISETLRMHSTAFLSRTCSKEFDLPPALPDSKPYRVTPGIEFIIPVSTIYKDPDYYPNPEKFDPDRFLDKKASSSDATTFGFGLGPRSCIGNRFAILEIKVLLVHLLHKCSLVPCKKTCIPMRCVKSSFEPVPKRGFWLKITPRN